MYDPISDLRHFPMPLQRFGKTPYGDNLYRVVFSPSRRHLIGGEWSDGHTGYDWVPTYDNLPACWVLERWLPPEEFAQCSKEDWDWKYADSASGYLLLGPYPSRGEYQLAHVFSTSPADGGIDNLIKLIEAGRQRSYAEHRAACQKQYADEEKDSDRIMEDRIRNRFPAFGIGTFSSSHVSRGTKTAPIRRTANELGLPIGRNKISIV